MNATNVRIPNASAPMPASNDSLRIDSTLLDAAAPFDDAPEITTGRTTIQELLGAQVSGRCGLLPGAVTSRPARRTSSLKTIPCAGRPGLPDGCQRGASFSDGRSLSGHEPHTHT